MISSLDIYALAGKNRAYDVSFPVTVIDEKLDIDFRGIADYGKLSAILVTETQYPGTLSSQ